MHKISLTSIGGMGKIEGNASPVICSACTSLAGVPEHCSDNLYIMQ